MWLGLAGFTHTKLSLILYIAVGTGPSLWPRKEDLTGKFQDQQQLGAVTIMTFFPYPMQRMNKRQWYLGTSYTFLPLFSCTWECCSRISARTSWEILENKSVIWLTQKGGSGGERAVNTTKCNEAELCSANWVSTAVSLHTGTCIG